MKRALANFLFIVALFAVPFVTEAALYAPGATINPSCGPTDADCGIATTTGSYDSFNATNATTTNLVVSNAFTFGSLTGILKAASGVVTQAVAGMDYIANNLGNWAGTWQNKNATDFLASTTSLTSTSTANSWSALQAFNGGMTFTNATSTGNAYFAGTLGVGTSALGTAKFAVASAVSAITDTFDTMGKIASLNSTTEASGHITLLTASCGSYSVTGLDGQTYGTVLGEDGKCWLSRNLGATRVATAYNDSQSYGELYQWGRLRDGHQLTNSATTDTISSADNPGTSSFILTSSGPNDWRSPQNDTLWGAGSRTNNVCPIGWHVPTQLEWATWTNAAGLTSGAGSGSSGSTLCGSTCPQAAYATSLKLPAAGWRNYDNGNLVNQGSGGVYWSSSPRDVEAFCLYFPESNVYPAGSYSRAYGFSVRCLQGS
jgi:uncharacterized protein (TIGR02145 family)